MSMNTIITIARQYGSGGREIGKRVSARLGVPFYDKELIAIAAKKSGMSEELFQKADETAANSLLYSLMLGSYNFGSHLTGPANLPINDKLFLIQSDIIKEAASTGPCVIVGRCADYVLREYPDCMRVYIHAEKEAREERAISEYGDKPEGISDFVQKKDKKRAAYYNFYTNKRWGDSSIYQLSLDSGWFGIDGCVELICRAVDERH